MNQNQKKIKKESLILGSLFKKLAPRLGAKVLSEPEWGIAGQITFKNGKKSYFRYNTLDLNPVGASDIAKDKDYSNFFMEQMGYPIVPGSRSFYSNEWAKLIHEPKRRIDDAYKHALRIGFPVVVKPNSGSQGTDVAVVRTKTEFYKAMRAVFRRDRIALVQKKVSGRDYRIVVLDDRVISAYERIPLHVIGDGKSTILQLLKKKQKEFIAQKRDTRIRFDDPRMSLKLKRQSLAFSSLVAKGERVFLLDNANLSTGGDAVDVTKEIHTEFAKLAIALTRDMGLRMCGVDVMVEGSITESPKKYHILEVNAAPGLDHYAKGNKSQEKIVEDLYFQVLKSLEHK